MQLQQAQVHPAELHPAYVWDCESCGTENFVRAVVHEFSPEESQELKAEGMEPQTGDWVTCPEMVCCCNCGQHYQAQHFRTPDGSTNE